MIFGRAFRTSLTRRRGRQAVKRESNLDIIETGGDIRFLGGAVGLFVSIYSSGVGFRGY